MSDSSQVNSGGSTSNAGSVAAKKPRSPVERAAVWGLIVVLLALVAAQARAKVGWSYTSSALRERIKLDEGSDAKPLAVKDLDQFLFGWPSRKVQERTSREQTITLTWTGISGPNGLFDPYGIDVLTTTGAEGLVLEVIPHGAPEPDKPMAQTAPDAGPSSSSPPPGLVGPAGPYGEGPSDGSPGGGGPGGGRFNPMDQDTDGDGKISKDEAQGRFKENFERNDTNADGFVDEAEIAAMRERFRSEGGAGRGRPEAESDSESGSRGAGGGGGTRQEFGPGGQTPGNAPAEPSGSNSPPAESTPKDSSVPKEGSATPAEGDKAPGGTAP
jgi:hypothetical protein